jgi:hypothetical protein
MILLLWICQRSKMTNINLNTHGGVEHDTPTEYQIPPSHLNRLRNRDLYSPRRQKEARVRQALYRELGSKFEKVRHLTCQAPPKLQAML